jgi:hypothetical protein
MTLRFGSSVPAAELESRADRIGYIGAVALHLLAVTDNVADRAHPLFAFAARLAPHSERHPVRVDHIDIAFEKRCFLGLNN